MMTLLNGAADLSNTSLLYIHRSDKPDHAYPTTSRNGLHELAEYMHSATLSGVARDTVATAWTLVAPQWLQHQNRIRALERGMKEVRQINRKASNQTNNNCRHLAYRSTKNVPPNSTTCRVTINGNTLLSQSKRNTTPKLSRSRCARSRRQFRRPI